MVCARAASVCVRARKSGMTRCIYDLIANRIVVCLAETAATHTHTIAANEINALDRPRADM